MLATYSDKLASMIETVEIEWNLIWKNHL